MNTDIRNAARTNTWLANRMYYLWEEHFADVPRTNVVLIKFGRGSRSQLGSIKWANQSTRIRSLLKRKSIREYADAQDDKRVTVITITRKFKDPSIPEFVVDSTIAHEMVHYTHGFSSPLKQRFAHPHKGGLIRKELESRGLGELHRAAKRWLKENWRMYITR
jgi:hypothetical protein